MSIWSPSGKPIIPRSFDVPVPDSKPVLPVQGKRKAARHGTGKTNGKTASRRTRSRTSLPHLRADASTTTTTLHEAARNDLRLKNWLPSNADINTVLSLSGPTLVKRAREQVTANAYAANAKEEFASSIVGNGIHFSSTLEDRDARLEVQALWREWSEEADADGQCDLYGLQDVVAGAMFDAGECFVRLRARRPQDGLSVPLQVQVLEAEMLDWAYNTILPNGNPVKAGIEFNAIGQRVAYHFWRQHPGDFISQNFKALSARSRVPAEDVLHVYEVTRPGQIRGVPKIIAGLVRLYLLDAYDDAELDRKKTAALLAGFITSPEGFDELNTFVGEEAVADEPGITSATWTPASFVTLNPGEEIAFSQPADVGGNYEAFQYRNLLAISAAVGVPYANMTGDVFRATYSSLRAEMLRFKRRAQRIQLKTMIHQFCRPVLRRFLEQAVLSGSLRGNAWEMGRKVTWILPKWPWVDPLKDRQAEKLSIEMGTNSRSASIIEEGRDPEEVDRQRAADQQRESLLEEEYGLKPGSLGTQEDKANAAPAAPAEKPEEAAPPGAPQEETEKAA